MSKTYLKDCPTCKGTGKIDVSWLQSTREALGITQEAVAGALGVTRTQYSNIERGLCTATTKQLRPLAKILNVTVDELLDMSYGEDTAVNDLESLGLAEANDDSNPPKLDTPARIGGEK